MRTGVSAGVVIGNWRQRWWPLLVIAVKVVVVWVAVVVIAVADLVVVDVCALVVVVADVVAEAVVVVDAALVGVDAWHSRGLVGTVVHVVTVCEMVVVVVRVLLSHLGSCSRRGGNVVAQCLGVVSL